jgi:hypothetical protein
MDGKLLCRHSGTDSSVEGHYRIAMGIGNLLQNVAAVENRRSGSDSWNPAVETRDYSSIADGIARKVRERPPLLDSVRPMPDGRSLPVDQVDARAPLEL